MSDESAKQRQSNAIGAAKEYLRLANETAFCSVNANYQKAQLYATLGVLRMQIELIELQWDTPCDCFAEMPLPDLLSPRER